MTKRILLGVSGSIAAYKSAEIVRLLTKRGYSVTCVLTESAEKFVSPFLLENLSSNRCYLDKELWQEQNLHIHLARDHDAFIIAPASANTVSKCAKGFADNLLTNIFLAFEGPRLLSPAMHTEMYNQDIIQENLNTLKEHGVYIFGPEVGELTSKDVGSGRLVNPETLVDIIPALFLPQLDLGDEKVMISIGGTKEAIDPVRVLTNRSSGRLGSHIAYLARLYNAKVSVVTTVELNDIEFESRTQVQTSDELKKALDSQIKDHTALIMAAAVSDFKPDYSESKIRRKKEGLSIELQATDDILKSLAKQKEETTFIGFHLGEEVTLEEEAIRKCKDKGCDYIVANTASSFGEDKRSYKIVNSEQLISEGNNASLSQMAHDILKRIKEN